MIKLSTFNKMNITTKTKYTVHVGAADGQIVDYFTVDYCDSDMERLNASILKRMELEKKGAKVEMINAMTAIPGALSVTVII